MMNAFIINKEELVSGEILAIVVKHISEEVKGDLLEALENEKKLPKNFETYMRNHDMVRKINNHINRYCWRECKTLWEMAQRGD